MAMVDAKSHRPARMLSGGKNRIRKDILMRNADFPGLFFSKYDFYHDEIPDGKCPKFTSCLYLAKSPNKSFVKGGVLSRQIHQ